MTVGGSIRRVKRNPSRSGGSAALRPSPTSPAVRAACGRRCVGTDPWGGIRSGTDKHTTLTVAMLVGMEGDFWIGSGVVADQWEPPVFTDAGSVFWMSVKGICWWHGRLAKFRRRYRFDHSGTAWWMVRVRDGKIVCGRDFKERVWHADG